MATKLPLKTSRQKFVESAITQPDLVEIWYVSALWASGGGGRD